MYLISTSVVFGGKFFETALLCFENAVRKAKLTRLISEFLQRLLRTQKFHSKKKSTEREPLETHKFFSGKKPINSIAIENQLNINQSYRILTLHFDSTKIP